MLVQKRVNARPQTRRILLALVLPTLAAGRAGAQAVKNQLDDLVSKATIAPADKTRISTRAKELCDQLAAASNRPSDRDREAARKRLLDELTAGKPGSAFRNEAAAEATKQLRPRIEGTGTIAWEAVHVLAELVNASTRDALITALSSKSAAIRYEAARGLRDMQGQLTDRSTYGPVISALGSAGAAETDPVVLRMIFQALDFRARQPRFRGLDDAAAQLGEIFKVHVSRADIDDFAADMPGIQLAASVAAAMNAPSVPLAQSLAAMLWEAIRVAREDPSPDTVATVAAIETALHAAIDRRTPAAKGTSIAGLLPTAPPKGKPDTKQLDAAIARLFGTQSRAGVLNGDPWQVKVH